MRNVINDCITSGGIIDLKSAFNAGEKEWDICDNDDGVHSIVDLVYRHMILEQHDGNAIVLVGCEFPALKQKITKELRKKCYWLSDWTESYKKLDGALWDEDDTVLCSNNESVHVTSNADVYDEQPGWCCLKIEYMAGSSRAKQKERSKEPAK